MAAILLNKGEQSLLDTWLVGTTSARNPGTDFGIGLAVVTGGVGAMTKTWVYGTNPATTLQEVGQNGVVGGYGRQTLNRNDDGVTPKWPASTLVSTNYQCTGTQVTFTFSAAPNANGATVWFCALSVSSAASDILFAADLAATRTFATGDTEKVTPTFRAT